MTNYRQVMLRLSQETKAMLDALSGITGTSIWQIVDHAIAGYVRQLPAAQQKLIGAVRTSRAKSVSES